MKEIYHFHVTAFCNKPGMTEMLEGWLRQNTLPFNAVAVASDLMTAHKVAQEIQRKYITSTSSTVAAFY